MSADFIQGIQTVTACPACSHRIDGWTGTDGVPPRVSDLTICLYCAAVLVFQEDMSVAVFQGVEQLSDKERQAVVEAQRRVREIRQP